jgi:deoxyribose-phosphate aldolase
VKDIAQVIDHTLLRPDAHAGEIRTLCEEAATYQFHSVCIHPSFIRAAQEMLRNSSVKIATVIGFPLGMTLSRVKIYEALEASVSGADELDIVINVGAAKSGDWSLVEKEIADIVTATGHCLHKVIIETCYLTEEEKKAACTAVLHSGAAFIKTSTGFGPAGAAIDDIQLLRSLSKDRLGIKASGGIRTLSHVRAVIAAGATRIGTSSGVAIMKETGIK